MNFIQGFITTLGLDHTFFFQFVVVVLSYLVFTKLFIWPYVKKARKREEQTKGRLKDDGLLIQKIEDLKTEFESETRKWSEEFQLVFKKETEEILKKHGESLAELFQEKELRLKQAQEKLLKVKKEEELQLKQDFPFLVETLTKKLRGIS